MDMWKLPRSSALSKMGVNVWPSSDLDCRVDFMLEVHQGILSVLRCEHLSLVLTAVFLELVFVSKELGLWVKERSLRARLGIDVEGS